MLGMTGDVCEDVEMDGGDDSVDVWGIHSGMF